MKTWVRFSLCWLLTFVLMATALAQPPAGHPIERFATGESVRVRTTDGRTLEGTLQSKGTQDFQIRTRSDQDMRLLYSEVRSVKSLRKAGSKHQVLWIVVGGVAVAALAIGLFFKARLENE